MKIRIKGNSIRLRLTKSEVHQLATLGKVSESTSFPNGALNYHLISDTAVPNLSASFSDNEISIRMPKVWAQAWEKSDQVGHEVTLENSLYLLIEKDFACLDNSREDQSDNYPNPNEKC